MIKIFNISAADSMLISMDITAPLYWWKEFEEQSNLITYSYRRPVIISTLYSREDRDFVIDDFSCECLNCNNRAYLYEILKILNEAHDAHQRDPLAVSPCWQMIQLLPASINEKRTVTFEYCALVDMMRLGTDRPYEWYDFAEIINNTCTLRHLIKNKEKNK